MTTTAHSVAPEDIMAFLDGELSAAEAQAVSLHLDTCTNCAALAEDLRSTSQSLARWVVPAIPQELEDRVHDAATKTAATNKTVRPNRHVSANRKLWVFGSVGVLATTILVAVVFWPQPRYHMYEASSLAPAPARQISTLNAPPPADRPSGEKSEPISGVVSHGYVAPSPPEPQSLPNAADMVSPEIEDKAAKAPPKPAAPPLTGFATFGGGGGQSKFPPSPSIAANPAPMIARTVSLTIQVKDAVTARAALDQILTRHHGYSAQLTADTSENSARTLQASLRIPAPELSAALADLKTLGRVQTESQAGEEVTQQHEDLVARLITARGTEERLRAILQQRTGRVSDVLEVEEEIARVRGEIEGMEADQKNLEHRVDFATIDVQLAEQFKAQLNSPADSATTRMHNAFVAGYHNATDTLLGFLLFFEEYGPTILIWLAILAAPVLLAWRRYRRLRSSL